MCKHCRKVSRNRLSRDDATESLVDRERIDLAELRDGPTPCGYASTNWPRCSPRVSSPARN
jgi:hypothetical protein